MHRIVSLPIFYPVSRTGFKKRFTCSESIRARRDTRASTVHAFPRFFRHEILLKMLHRDAAPRPKRFLSRAIRHCKFLRKWMNNGPKQRDKSFLPSSEDPMKRIATELKNKFFVSNTLREGEEEGKDRSDTKERGSGKGRTEQSELSPSKKFKRVLFFLRSLAKFISGKNEIYR